MGKVRALVKRLDSINEWAGRTCGWLIVVVTILMLYEVVTRRVFNAPTVWTNEVTTQVFGAYFLLVAGYTLLYNAHVRVDVLYFRWSDRTKAIVDTITYVIFFFAFVGMGLIGAVDDAVESFVSMDKSYGIFAVVLWPIRTVMVLALLLLFIQGVSNFIKNIIFVTRKVKL